MSREVGSSGEETGDGRIGWTVNGLVDGEVLIRSGVASSAIATPCWMPPSPTVDILQPTVNVKEGW